MASVWSVRAWPDKLRAMLFGVDRAAAALVLHAKAGQTMSLMAALAERRGDRWGCVFCRVLGLLQRDHCALTLDTGDVGHVQGWAAIRIGVALWTMVTLVMWASWAVCEAMLVVAGKTL